jgi:hypothetical protein
MQSGKKQCGLLGASLLITGIQTAINISWRVIDPLADVFLSFLNIEWAEFGSALDFNLFDTTQTNIISGPFP